MGVAAYNRGSEAIRRALDRENAKDPLFEIFDRLNEYPRGSRAPFGGTVIRRLEPPGKWPWVIMNNPEKGWDSYGYSYKSLKDLFAVWNVYVVGCGNDEHSFYYAVEPGKAKDRQ